MKKIFLTFALLVSGYSFADFNITTLDCEKTNTKSRFVNKLSLRIDEKRKTIRFNLLPEAPLVRVGVYYQLKMNYNDFDYEIWLNSQDLNLNWGRLHKEDKEEGKGFLRENYSCKII